MTTTRTRTIATTAVLAACWVGCAHTGPPAPSSHEMLDHALGEEVVFVPAQNEQREVIYLETTLYRPTTPPPWPLVVFNHGSNGKPSSHHLQPRERPGEMARFFSSRGYLVVAPMREGFSRSTGESHFRCDHAAYALRYAANIGAVVGFFVDRGDAKPDQILVVGQSNGGMVTLGYGADRPRARALINISGGVDTERPTCDWRSSMIEAAKTLGARTTTPSLWLYADDDAHFPPSVSRPFFDAYRGAGAPAALITYPRGGHGFAVKKGGAKTWGADVEHFLSTVGLPFTPG